MKKKDKISTIEILYITQIYNTVPADVNAYSTILFLHSFSNGLQPDLYTGGKADNLVLLMVIRREEK